MRRVRLQRQVAGVQALLGDGRKAGANQNIEIQICAQKNIHNISESHRRAARLVLVQMRLAVDPDVLPEERRKVEVPLRQLTLHRRRLRRALQREPRRGAALAQRLGQLLQPGGEEVGGTSAPRHAFFIRGLGVQYKPWSQRGSCLLVGGHLHRLRRARRGAEDGESLH